MTISSFIPLLWYGLSTQHILGAEGPVAVALALVESLAIRTMLSWGDGVYDSSVGCCGAQRTR